MDKETVVCNWVCHIKQVIALDLASLQDEDKIGAHVVVAEIDESKLGKRNYHQVKGVLVICGVKSTLTCQMFAVHVNDCTAKPILDLIKATVNPGFIIHTDCWRGYRGYHPRYAASYGTPTNAIEGTRAGI